MNKLIQLIKFFQVDEIKYYIVRRPFFFIASAAVIGILSAYLLISLEFFLLLEITLILLFFINIILIYSLFEYAQLNLKTKLVIIAVSFSLLSSFFLYSYQEYRYFQSSLNNINLEKDSYNIQGYLQKDLGNLNGDYFYIDVKKINYKNNNYGKISVKKDKLTFIKDGAQISLNLKLSRPAKKLNPGGFSYREYLKKQEVIMQGWDAENILVIKENFSFKNVLISLKLKLLRVIEELFSQRISAFLKAVLLGERAELSYQMESLLKKTGASHLLALSGLHAGIIIMALNLIFSRLFKSRKLSFFLLAVISLLYVIIVGAPISIIRASLLTLLYLFSDQIYREADFFNIIALTLLVNIFINPYALFTVSLQLSYSIVISIYLLSDFLKNNLSGILSVSAAVQLASIPLTAYYFGEYAYIGLITNIWLIPAIAVLLPISFLTVLTAFLIPYLALFIAAALEICYQLLFRALEIMSYIQGEMLVIPKPSLLKMFLYYIFLFSLPYLFKNRRISLSAKRWIFNNKKLSRYFLIGFITVFALFFINFSSHYLEINFLAVGQGDGIYIDFPDGKNMLIDTGPGGEEGRQAEYSIISFLNSRGISEIDYLLLSHFDSDHSGSLYHLLARRKIKSIIISLHDQDNSFQQKLIKKTKQDNIQLYFAGEGSQIDFKNCSVEFLHPPPDRVYRDENSNSLVFILKYGKYSFLFTGDITKEIEQKIVEKHSLQNITVLKAAHHGSSTSTGKTLIKQTNPNLAVISVGRNNFGHPDESVLERLKEYNVQYLRTDIAGAVNIKTDGVNISFEKFIK